MALEEEAMVEGNGKEAQGLLWRSRNKSWWTSAVDLSSTLLSRMDQVPAMGFTLPWLAGGGGDQSKGPASPAEVAESQSVEFSRARDEIARLAFDVAPKENAKPSLGCEPAAVVDSSEGDPAEGNSNSPKGGTAEDEIRLTPRGAESRRRTRRMPVELAPAALSRNDDADLPFRSKKLSAVGREILLGDGQGTTRVYAEDMRRLCRHRKQLSEAAIRRVDNASLFSSRRSCQSSRSWSRLEEFIRNNPPHALPAPPSDSTKTEDSLLPWDFYRVLNPDQLREDAGILGGSMRVTRQSQDMLETQLASLPTSPRCNKESRASKLFRTLGISTARAENEVVMVKQKGCPAANHLVVSQHQEFAKSLEPRELGRNSGVRNHEEDSKATACVEHSRKKRSATVWTFKWIWGSSKPAALPKFARAPQQPRGTPPQEPKPKRHKRVKSWSCASHTSTSVIIPLRRSRIHQDDNGATENTLESRVSCDVGEVFQDFETPGSSRGQESFRTSEVFEDCHGSFRSVSSPSSFSQSEDFENCHGSFRSVSDRAGFRRAEVFEDCHHGSFRSVASGSSFRSFDSADGIEWSFPPPLQVDQTLTIGDVAALCNSSLKFVFKCREIQPFNKFLRSQKKRLLRASGSSDCFNVILSGTDIEVSSMVAAMAYAWFLDKTKPKVTGKTWHAVAMIDIPRHQMHKHKDAAWLFDACGIDPAALLFADEMELASLVGAGRIKISTIGQDILVTRNEVGSVCTLLWEKLAAEAQGLLEPRYMKTLLLAGVLLDTENLDFASMRDTEITTALLVGSGSLGRNGFFDQLREVEDDDEVSKHISRSYGDAKHLSSQSSSSAAPAKLPQEADQEHSDKDSLFTQSHDRTSPSETGTSSSSVDEDSPRLKQRSSFKFIKLSSRAAPTRSPQLISPRRRKDDENVAAHIRKAATTHSVFPRLRKKLVLYRG